MCAAQERAMRAEEFLHTLRAISNGQSGEMPAVCFDGANVPWKCADCPYAAEFLAEANKTSYAEQLRFYDKEAERERKKRSLTNCSRRGAGAARRQKNCSAAEGRKGDKNGTFSKDLLRLWRQKGFGYGAYGVQGQLAVPHSEKSGRAGVRIFPSRGRAFHVPPLRQRADFVAF